MSDFINTENTDFKKFIVFKYDNEDIEFRVPFEHAKISDLINELMEDRFDKNDEIQEEILPINNDKIKVSIFPKIIDFFKHYHNEPMKNFSTPINSFDLSDLVQEWYVQFAYGSSFTSITEEEVRDLRDIILAANFLGIQPLLKLTLVKMGILTEKNTSILEKTFKKGVEESNNSSKEVNESIESTESTEN